MLSALRQACNAIISSAALPSSWLATRTWYPSSRNIRVQRALVVTLPDRDHERTGVISMTFMSTSITARPTSGATADILAAQLNETRARTFHLTADLSADRLMGPMLPIVNPVLWEIGHVGWFHEYWTLRHAHGATPLLDQADRLWNSSTVAHATRWK